MGQWSIGWELGASRTLPASLALRTFSSRTPSPLPGRVPRGEGRVARALVCGQIQQATERFGGLHSSCEYPCARGSVALNSKIKTKQTKQQHERAREKLWEKRKSSPPPFFNQEVPHFHFALGPSN